MIYLAFNISYKVDINTLRSMLIFVNDIPKINENLLCGVIEDFNGKFVDTKHVTNKILYIRNMSKSFGIAKDSEYEYFYVIRKSYKNLFPYIIILKDIPEIGKYLQGKRILVNETKLKFVDYISSSVCTEFLERDGIIYAGVYSKLRKSIIPYVCIIMK